MFLGLLFSCFLLPSDPVRPFPVEGFAGVVDHHPVYVSKGRLVRQGRPVWPEQEQVLFAAVTKGGAVQTVRQVPKRGGLFQGQMLAINETRFDGRNLLSHGLTLVDRDALVWGIDNGAPSGSSHGWVVRQGEHAWERVLPMSGYTMLLAAHVTDDHIVVAGAHNPSAGTYVPVALGLDKQTGETLFQHDLPLGKWAMAHAVFQWKGQTWLLGERQPDQPLNHRAGAPFLSVITKAGFETPIEPSVEPFVFEDVVVADDGLWILARRELQEPSNVYKEGVGVLLRFDGTHTEEWMTPDCLPFRDLVADGRTLWLGGQTDDFPKTGFLTSVDLDDKGSWIRREACPKKIDPRARQLTP